MNFVSRESQIDDNAVLTKGPKNLWVLWEEWVRSINRNKAAQLFNEKERGRCKVSFSQRKVFWDAVSWLIRAREYTVETAINAVYMDYQGEQYVTKILKKLQQDLHPDLVVYFVDFTGVFHYNNPFQHSQH